MDGELRSAPPPARRSSTATRRLLHLEHVLQLAAHEHIPAFTDLEAKCLRDAARWAHHNLTNPNPDLGRSGPVCPWVDPSMRRRRLLLTAVDATQTDAQVDADMMALFHHFLEEMAPTSGSERQYKSIITVLSGIPDERVQTYVDALHQRLKPTFVNRGLMLGEFYATCPKRGLRNPEFRPLRSTTPLLVIRSMVSQDIAFLSDRDEFVKAYDRHFPKSAR